MIAHHWTDSTRGRANFGWIAALAAMILGSAAGAQAAEVAATVDWSRRLELSTPVSGVVESVQVDVGNRIQRGEVLLRLDPRGFRARVEQAKAEVDGTRAALAEAEREVERAQELYERTVVATHELQLSKVAAARARADHQRALARLEQAELDLEYSTVRAPYDAIVLRRQVEPGQTVVTRLQSTPLLVVAESTKRVARAQVSAGRLGRLRLGQELAVDVAGERFAGTLRRMGLEPQGGGENEPLYALEVVFEVPADAEIRAGQAVTLELP